MPTHLVYLTASRTWTQAGTEAGVIGRVWVWLNYREQAGARWLHDLHHQLRKQSALQTILLDDGMTSVAVGAMRECKSNHPLFVSYLCAMHYRSSWLRDRCVSWRLCHVTDVRDLTL